MEEKPRCSENVETNSPKFIRASDSKLYMSPSSCHPSLPTPPPAPLHHPPSLPHPPHPPPPLALNLRSEIRAFLRTQKKQRLFGQRPQRAPGDKIL